jgi:hypothetical protein
MFLFDEAAWRKLNSTVQYILPMLLLTEVQSNQRNREFESMLMFSTEGVGMMQEEPKGFDSSCISPHETIRTLFFSSLVSRQCQL